jgi:2-C-methyl-D-erythritol 4-phosphate cytidylyltransferase/2-C-methyl-D-erythritol 2,4-cyclodiphosphate synthase
MAGKVAAIVVAAGRGLRAGGNIPKQYRKVGNAAVIRASIDTLAAHEGIVAVQPVINPEDERLYGAACRGLSVRAPVFGGATRQASVRAGLKALASLAPELVIVHDAVRPFASASLISRAIAAAAKHRAAVPVVPLVDTVKTIDPCGTVTGTLDRAQLRAVQTPQAFDFAALIEAHRRAEAAGHDDFTDDAALVEWAGLKVGTFEGETGNVKLTTAEDFARLEAMQIAALGDVRMGFGFDVHPFAEGDHVTLGGVRIAHARSIAGHSDADVVLHALVDAILGALAEGDIGVHFPPSDPRWRGASSDGFLAFAAERVHTRGGSIGHLDVTIVCEEPRIGPHRDAMRARIAEIVGLPISRVAVKATTSERLGFTGRREGIVAFANATIRLPWSD